MPAPSNSLGYFSAFAPVTTEERQRLHPDGLPFALTGIAATEPQPARSAVVICFHGFTAMPYVVTPVARAIASVGLAAAGPLLPGHGWRDRADQEREFSKITRQSLLAAARAEVQRAREQYDFVAVYGDSMGGAIALSLAAEGLVDACAVTAPALCLPFRGAVLARYLGWLNFSVPKKYRRQFYAPCYQFENSRAGRALWELARHARAGLDRVSCPVFAAHSHRDRTVNYCASEWVRDRVRGPVEVQWFDRSGHVLPLDVQGPEVAAAVARFFRQRFAEFCDRQRAEFVSSNRSLDSDTHEPAQGRWVADGGSQADHSQTLPLDAWAY
ncbi:MAG: esterase [Oscillatoriales cyanobacterium]|nr:MAG: esterase [Oscillatoriales cyanobacterium]